MARIDNVLNDIRTVCSVLHTTARTGKNGIKCIEVSKRFRISSQTDESLNFNDFHRNNEPKRKLIAGEAKPVQSNTLMLHAKYPLVVKRLN